MLNQFCLSIQRHDLFQLNPVPSSFNHKERGANLFHSHTRAAGQGLRNGENTRAKREMNSKGANLIASFAPERCYSLTNVEVQWVVGNRAFNYRGLRFKSLNADPTV